MLVQFRDGELDPVQTRDVEAHLAQCDSCRLDLHRLRSALGEVRRISASASPDTQLTAIWEGVRQRICAWEERRGRPGNSDSTVRRRVASQIAPFLGNYGAVKVTEPASGDSGRLLNEVEVVLGEFLGRGAAALIVNRAVDTAIVKS